MNSDYLRIRNFLGVLGCLLPLLCIIGASFSPNTIHHEWWTSISITYYSSPVLIGVLSSVGFLLITYRGYNIWDTIVNSLAGVFALGVVCFPCDCPWLDESELVGLFWLPISTSKWIHYSSAAMLFFMLAINSIWLFSKSNDEQKNSLYRVCGYIILIDLFIFALNAFFLHIEWTVIVNESIMLLAFGISWIVKGHLLDKWFE